MSHPDPTKRTHRAAIESSRDNTKGGEIRQSKNARSAKRRAAIRDRRLAVIEDRLAAWQGLTPQQQLAELDRRLGPGQGASRQRARIVKMLVVV